MVVWRGDELFPQGDEGLDIASASHNQDGYVHAWQASEVVGHGLEVITTVTPIELRELGLFGMRRVVLYDLGCFLAAVVAIKMALQLGYRRRADWNIESAIVGRESCVLADGVNRSLVLAS
jgi:hypothetical protein